MRAEGREPNKIRPVTITRNFIPTAEGSVLFEMGQTRVICTATIEDKVPPFLKDKGQGWVTAEYALLPRSTSVRAPRESVKGKLSGRTHEIQRLIGRSMRSVIDMQMLGERTITLDCDVIQADGGTRTASITGAFICLIDAIHHAIEIGMLTGSPIRDHLAAISVGIVAGKPLLDLDYKEDFGAEVDMNVVMTGSGTFVELQGTAETKPFDRAMMDRLIDLASSGISELITLQKAEIPGDMVKLN